MTRKTLAKVLIVAFIAQIILTVGFSLNKLNTVNAEERILAEISVSLTGTPITIGQTQQISVIAEYSDGSNQDVTLLSEYHIDNDEILSITPEGLVTGISVGQAEISIVYGSFTKIQLISVVEPEITPTPSPEPEKQITGITLDAVSYTLKTNEAHATIVSANYSDLSTEIVTSDATYVSSNTDVVVVDNAGIVIAISTGEATIAVSYMDKSATISVLVEEQTLLIEPPLLMAPSNLRAIIEQANVILSWDTVEGATGYEIYRNNELLNRVATNLYTDGNIRVGTNYSYCVKAIDDIGNTSLESEQVLISLEDIDPPSAPTNLRVKSKTTTSFTLAWDASTDDVGVASYDIFMDNSLIGLAVDGSTEFTASNLIQGQNHTFYIIAKDVSGKESQASNSLLVVGSTTVSGSIIQDTTWTLNNSPYILNSNISISAGVTLTIEPGVIVKGNSSSMLRINGTLVATGTEEQPIVFTAIKDFMYGGSGVVNQNDYWRGISIAATGEFEGDHVKVRYGFDNNSCGSIYVTGKLNLNNSEVSNSYLYGVNLDASKNVNIRNTRIENSRGANIYIPQTGEGAILIEDNIIINSQNYGLQINHNGTGSLLIRTNQISSNSYGIDVEGYENGDLEINGNNITNNTNSALYVNLNAIKGQVFEHISDNIMTENGTNAIEIIGTIAANLRLYKIASPYVLINIPTINPGVTLTVDPGVVIKSKNNSMLRVNGTLSAIGTEDQPIVFTTIKDSSYGGSGVSSQNDYWRGIYIASTGEFNGDYVKVRYGNDAYASGSIYVAGKLNLINCEISNSYNYGIYLDAPKNATINNSRIENSIKQNIYIAKTGEGIVLIENNVITSSQNYGLQINHNGIGSSIIRDNLISNNFYGIDIVGYENGDLEISGNNITNNTYAAFQVNLDAIKGQVFEHIFDNIMTENGTNAIEIIGTIAANLRLYKIASPYVLINIPTINPGVTLTVDPGVVIKSKNNSMLRVNGTLFAIGTEDQPIVFTTIKDPSYGGSGVSSQNDYWRGIYIASTGEFNGDYVKVRYGNDAYASGSIYVAGKLNLINSEIINYYQNGIWFDTLNQSTLLANSFRSYNLSSYGIYNSRPSQITINAKYNYWGSIYGPTAGSRINTGVDYIPYLGEEIKIQSQFGKPGINAATGNFSRTYTDMDMSVPGFKINISRTYNSGDNRDDGLMGRGWTFGFQGSIKDYGYDNSTKIVRLPDGGAQSFKQNTDGSYTASDSRSTLIKATDGTHILTTKDQYTYGFNTSGYLSWMKDRNGNTVTVNTDSNGKVLTITDQNGRQFTIAYNQNNQIKSITDAMGRSTQYTYDSDRLVSVKNPSGISTYYNYSSYTFDGETQWLLTEIKDHNNNTIESVTYYQDGTNDGKVKTTTDQNGNTRTLAYDNGYRKTTITDTNGRQTTQWYDISFNITNTKDAEEKYTSIEYFTDSNGNNVYGEEKSVTDRNGNKTQYERDPRGNITKIINPDGSYKLNTYDEKNNVTSERDESGKYTFYVYDSNKILLLKKAQPLNGTDVYSPGCDESKFAITTYSYYAEGEEGYTVKRLLKSVTDPEGNTTTYTYDQYGNGKTVSDPETGKVTTNEYNLMGWKMAEITAKGYRTEYVYNKNGNIVKIIKYGPDSIKSIYRTVYDDLGRKIHEISPNQYDPAKDGLDVEAGIDTYNDSNAGYRYTYYDNGNLKTVTDPENNTTSYTYDLYGNVLTETRPNGSIMVYEYDVMNRLIKKFFKSDSASQRQLLEESQYTILADKNTSIQFKKYFTDTQAVITTTTYNYAGREIKRQNPDLTEIVTSYNPNGTIASVKNVNGGTSYFKYDGLNRLNEQWTPFEQSGSSTLYTYRKITYDKAGRQKSILLGKQLVSLYALPSSFSETVYDYYKNGKVKTVTENNRKKNGYAYDDDGNLSQETSYVSENEARVIEYDTNYLGKQTEKREHVRKGDISGNSFEDNAEIVLETLYTYDLNGNLKTITAPNQVTTTYEYDNLNRQTKVSKPGLDEHGNATTISTTATYDWEGNVLTSTDGNRNSTNYIYNQRGFLEKVIDPSGGTTTFWYDLAGRKIAEVSPEQYDSTKPLEELNRIIYSYDSMGRTLTKTFVGMEKTYNPSLGQWSEQPVSIVQKAYKYDNSGNVIKELDALGFEAGTGDVNGKINTGYGTTYTYNLANMVTKVCDPVSLERGLSYTTSYAYDALSRKISETNAKGVVTVYEYDVDGNVIKVQVKASSTATPQTIKQTTYDYLGNALTVTDGNGNTTAFEYNAFNKLRRADYPGDSTIPGNTVTYQYSKMGDVTLQKDSIGRMDIFTYDDQGRLLSQTVQNSDASSSITTSVRYDGNGNKRFTTDGNGNVTEYSYDGLNRLTDTEGVVSGVTHHTHYTYDKNGNQTSITDWRDNVSESVYDSLNRLIEKKDPYGNSIQKLTYNHNNAQLKSYDALDNATEFAYDKNNRLLSTQDAEGHTTRQTYDNVGNMLTKVDGNNNTTTYDYDAFNRLIKVTNAKAENTSYTYDLNGNMLTQTDGKGNTQVFEYNVANKMIRRIDAGGRTGSSGNYTYNPAKTESYTYDANGNLKSKSDRNGKNTLYTYDVFGRLTNSDVGDSHISYTYDDNGNQLTMEDSTGITSRSYDELNRVITKSVPHIGVTTFTYDITQDIQEGCYAEETTDPKGNKTLKVYDKVGRLKDVTAYGDTTSYEYFANGNRKSVVYGSGLREDYTYFKDNLLKTLTNRKADSTVIDSYNYTYDGAHNQLTKVDAKGTTTYTYDELNRLNSVLEPSGKSTVYTYDKSGNRETETIVGSGITTLNTYSYNEQNRLLGINTKVNGVQTSTTVYTYDNNGNQLITKVNGATVLDNTYNALNQLVGTVNSTGAISYAYNAEGYRVTKVVNGDTTRYLYEADKVVLEVDETGNQIGYNVYGLNLLMRTVDQETYCYLYNGHADVTALITLDGTLAATYYYDAFGNITEQTGDIDNSITYSGYQFDKETGLYYLNSRYYDSVTARFLSEDTYRGQINDPLSLNLYTYCHNEPIMYSDPTGHTEWDKKNLSTTDYAKLEKIWNQYASAKDAKVKASLHDQAEAIRDKYRSDNEVGSNTGYTYTAVSQTQFKIDFKLNDYDLKYGSPVNKPDTMIVAHKNTGEMASKQSVQDSKNAKAIEISALNDYGAGLQGSLTALAKIAQTGLNIAGLIPGVGAGPDIASGFISLGLGDVDSAAISFASALPVGDIAMAGKVIKKADNAVDATGNGVKIVDDIAEAGSKTGYKLKPDIDLDLRGTGKTYQDALDEAFKRTGVPKENFEVTKWAKDANGKSFPVEWRAKNGAEVNIDIGHTTNGPDVPHIGYQTPGKRGTGGAARGHIFVDDVPVNR